jgi:hypothetical protein
MKKMPISAEQARTFLRVATKTAQQGAEVFRRAIPIVSAIAVVVREIKRFRK